MRKSNIELLRIISMLFICLHHFSVHGPWPSTGGGLPHAVIDVLSMGGKTGVDCFILITGYFLVKSSFKSRSLAKLLFETLFYSLVILFAFYWIDLSSTASIDLLRYFLPTTSGLYWFMTSYVALYLLSPFVNKLLNGCSTSSFSLLVSLGFALFSVVPTVTTFNPVASNLVWFVYLYCLGAFIRRVKDSPVDLKQKVGLNPVFIVRALGPLLCAVGASIFMASSAVFIDYANARISGFHGSARYFMMQNSITQVILSLALFMLFERMPLGSNRIVNAIAGTTLGVYLIHDNPLVRTWLWAHFDWAFGRDIVLMIAVGFAVTFFVFGICSIVELVRKRFVERPFMIVLDKVSGAWLDRVDRAMASVN